MMRGNSMRHYILAILGLMLLFSSCKLIFKTPEVEKIQDVELQSFSADRTRLKLSVIVHNPNNYEIRLSSLKLDLLDKNRFRVGTAAIKQSLDLPKKKSINVDLDVDLLTRPLIQNVSNINHNVHFFIAGKDDARAMGISKRFSFEEPYDLSLKEHLQDKLTNFGGGGGSGQDIFILTRTYVGDMGISKSELNADFILLNPYGLSFNFKGFPAKILVDGKEVGRGQLKNQLSFDADVFHKEGTMVFELSNLKSLVGATRGAFKGEIAYCVQGTIILEGLGMELKSPFEFTGALPVSVWDLLLK